MEISWECWEITKKSRKKEEIIKKRRRPQDKNQTDHKLRIYLLFYYHSLAQLRIYFQIIRWSVRQAKEKQRTPLHFNFEIFADWNLDKIYRSFKEKYHDKGSIEKEDFHDQRS